MNNFIKKSKVGVVINTNKSGLVQARRRKKLLKEKDTKINDLESRIKRLEELFSNQQMDNI